MSDSKDEKEGTEVNSGAHIAFYDPPGFLWPLSQVSRNLLDRYANQGTLYVQKIETTFA